MPERSADSVPAQHPLLVLALGLLGFAAGVGLLLVGGWNTTRSSDFISSSGFGVWAAVIGAQTGFWAIVAGPLWSDLTRTWRRATMGRAGTVMLAGALGLVVVVLPFVSPAGDIDWPLWGYQVKVRVLTTVGGVLIGVPALCGIGLVQERARGQKGDPIGDDDVPTALEMRSELHRYLGVAGAAIGLAVLAASALRRAVVPDFVAGTEFAAEAIVLYGAFFTGLLLLAYGPAHLALRRFGLRIRDHYFPLATMPRPDADGFRDWLDRRAKLEGMLQLDVSLLQQLQTSLFILAPLLSAIVPALLPNVG